MNDRRRVGILTAVGLFAAAVFVVDLLTPPGLEVWVFYLPVILTPVLFNNARQVVFVSAACSALVATCFFWSPMGGHPPLWDLLNRGSGLIAIWIMAGTGIIICKRSTRLAAVMSDLNQTIAKQLRTEQALSENEERLRLAMQGAGMGTWDANLLTGKLIWSETQFRILGYQPAPTGEATEEMWLCRLHPDDRRRVLEARDEARRDHSLYCVEYRVLRPDREHPAWLTVFGRYLYDSSGEAIRFVGVSFDITRRKELEGEVLHIAAREQQQIGQELHDGVGQELTGLALMAQSLAQRLPEGGAEKRVASRVIAGLDQVHQKVRDLSRGLIPVHVEAKGLLAALDDLAAKARERSGIPVTFACPEWVQMPDHATGTQLFRIAQEAVTNALRHGRPRQIRLSLLAEPDGLRLRIKDDGIGIQRRPPDSDGLGLRIMHYRAELIQGVLQIAASEGGGTVVTCTLPRSKSNGEKEPGTRAGASVDR